MYATATESQTGLKTVGYAGMKPDGTIFMRVRSREFNSLQRPLVFCAPGDDNYVQVFAHLGSLMPGQTEPISGF
jgi:hypothetical protein